MARRLIRDPRRQELRARNEKGTDTARMMARTEPAKSVDNLFFAGKSRNRAASLSEGRGAPTAQMQGVTCPCWGSRLDRRAQHERQGHPSAPATYLSLVITRDHSMIALGTQAGLKAKALRGELASSGLRFAPEEHDKDHAHHGQKWR